jgi:uncharacterized membrane protein YphA (DoxX/SURF4 family)
LQRLYSTFPGGLPGVGLLLLRAAIGERFISEGCGYLLSDRGINLETSIISLLFVTLGFAIAVGILTPVAGGLSALAGIAFHLWHPMPGREFLVGYLLTPNIIIMATATACLGPGALSVDAYLFGRRKIVIARTSNS